MYCSNCGKEKTKVFSGVYNINNGEKIYEEKCLECEEKDNLKCFIMVIIFSIAFLGMIFLGTANM